MNLYTSPAPAPAASGDARARIVAHADIGPIWRDLAANGVFTPYQTPHWIDGLGAAYRWPNQAVEWLVIERGTASIAALPFMVRQTGPIRIAEIPGADIGNSDWFPQRSDIALDRDVLDKAFALLAGERRIDLVRFLNLPPRVGGIANPLLAYPHHTAPDHLYLGSIDAQTLATLPKRRRVDITRGQRRIEEQFGPVTLRRAFSPAEIDVVHAAFIEQRNVRFREMGIANVFAEPHFMRLFRDLSVASLEMDVPVMRFDALYAGDDILATAIGVQHRTHYSQYINSNTDGPASKYSLVGLLMLLLVEDLVASGMTSIDMGVGDFAYKETWTQKTAVHDLILPLSLRGRLAAPALGARRAVKRFIKQNDNLWSLSKKIRLLVPRPGGH